VALFTFDRQVYPLSSFEQWNAAPLSERSSLVTATLTRTSPGWGSTQLGNALVQAAEALADTSGKNSTEHSRIELITDLQEGSRLEQLQGYEWPKGVEVSINQLKPLHTGNASLQLVSDTDEVSDAKASAQVRVRVSNMAGSKHEQMKIGWASAASASFAAPPQELYVPAGQSRVVTVPAPSVGSLDRVVLQGDDDDFDNTVFTSPPEVLRLNVTYLGTESETDTRQGLYFLKRAFQETRHQTVVIKSHLPSEALNPEELQQSSLVIVAAPLSDGAAQAIRAQVTGGKSALVVVDSSALQSTLRGLLQQEQLKIEEVRPPSYAMLGEIDFRHPIFSPFADPRFSDFTKIHFWRYARLDANQLSDAHALARFDSGDPALLEVPTGAGRILILTSGWQPESSRLALSSKFVPLLYSILESGGVPEPL